MLDRHPGLVIENCASGGMRTDYALLSRLQLQSTSDQQDYLRYPPIAAAAPAAIAPEQAGVWAYPQPEFTDDEIAFTLCSAMLGRVHLSGHLDRMSQPQRDLVAEAVRAYKAIRARPAPARCRSGRSACRAGRIRWSRWACAPADVSYLTVWRRDALGRPERPAGPASHALCVPHLAGRPVRAEVLYPGPAAGAAVGWASTAGVLTVDLPRTPSACLIRLSPA